MKKTLFLLTFLLFFLTNIFTQNKKKIDSLNKVYLMAKDDTIKIKMLLSIGKQYQYTQSDSAFLYFQKALKSAQISKQAGLISDIYNSLGTYYFNKSNYEKALEYYSKALKIYEKIGKKAGVAANLGNIGIIYLYQDKTDKALEYYFKALKMYEEIKKKDGIAANLGNIGIVYKIQNNYEKALEYFFKALKINEEINNKSGIGDNLGNIGVIYENQNKNEKALEYYFKALKINKEIEREPYIGIILGNIGIIYAKKNNYNEALKYFFKALKINKKTKRKMGIAANFENIGGVYKKQNNYEKALEYYLAALKIDTEIGRKSRIVSDIIGIGDLYFNFKQYRKALEYNNKALKIAVDIGLSEQQSIIYKQLSENYFALKNYKKAYKNHVSYKNLSDSVLYRQYIAQQTQFDLKYKFEKEKQAIKLEQQKKDATVQKEIKYQNIIKNIFIVGLFIAILIALLLYRIVWIKKKNNDLLRKKNKEIIEKKDLIFKQKKELELKTEDLNNYKVNLEEIVVERTYDLIKAKRKAEVSDKLKTEFLNNMSHEVRTPLNAILGFSDIIINNNKINNRQIHFIKLINKSGEQLLNIIDSIIEMSKISSEKYIKKENVICLNSLLTNLYNFSLSKITKKNIQLIFNKKLPDDKSYILSDETKINTILKNLLLNAIKYTFEGQINIGYQILNNKTLDIYIKDTGIGISKENYDNIFIRFSQEEKKISQKTGGLGLGLAIARKNAKLIGGKITLKSQKGKGSIFTLSIPYKHTQKNKPIIPFIRKNVEHKKEYIILIAEDNKLNFLVIEAIIKNIDLKTKIIHAENGLEAINYCKQKAIPDIVLMDLMMPIMDGFEATKKIKSFLPNLPIIIQTAYVSEKEKEKSFLAGCDDFISKPISRNTFNEIVNKYLII